MYAGCRLLFGEWTKNSNKIIISFLRQQSHWRWAWGDCKKRSIILAKMTLVIKKDQRSSGGKENPALNNCYKTQTSIGCSNSRILAEKCFI